jgi:hypothetical protein
LGEEYKQTANIDLEGCDWTPIGDDPNQFAGLFDGGGFTITGLTINAATSDNQGMFGQTIRLARLENIGLVNVSVTGKNWVGGLVGLSRGTITNSYATGEVTGNYYVGGLVGSNYGTITDSYATGEVTGVDPVGGLVGYNLYGTITDSYATGEVTGDDYAGGLVGYNEDGTITNSYATGPVTATDDYAGGLVGYDYEGTITNSYATGPVTATDDYAGGLVGYIYDDSFITNSYATGDVTGDRYVGGLVGYNDETITNSYATGRVTGRIDVGGLVGRNPDTITDSFWDTETSGQPSSDGGTGKSTAEMQTLSTYTNTSTAGLTTAWKMVAATGLGDSSLTGPTERIWGINSASNGGYPFLWWQASSVPSGTGSGGSGGGSSDDGSSGGSSGVTPEATSPSASPTPEAPTAPARIAPRSAPTPAALTGPVLRGNAPPVPSATPSATVNGRPEVVTSTVTGSSGVSLRAGSFTVGMTVPQNQGGVTRQGTSTQVNVQKGASTPLQGSGVLPGSTVQVFLPLQGGNAKEIGRIASDSTGAFSGTALFATGVTEAPMPIGRQVLQIVSVAPDGQQTVVEMTINIGQSAPAPESNRQTQQLPVLTPGASLATEAGIPVSVRVNALEEQKQVTVEGDGWSMAVDLTGEGGTVRSTEGSAVMELVRNETALVSGTGFLPGSRADVWLFSTPTLLGTVTIDAEGNFVGEINVDPNAVAVGEHTLQLQGVGQDGYVRAANVGVVVSDPVTEVAVSTDEVAGTFLWWLWLLIALLVTAAVIVGIRYSRRARA